MGISKQEARLFLNKKVIVVHTDGSSAGKLVLVNESSLILDKNCHKTLIALASIEKIKERASL